MTCPAPQHDIKFFSPSPYYHGPKDRSRSHHVAGWGVWDMIQEDWFIEDGFETEEAARAAAERMNAALNAELRAARVNWKSVPHGLAHGGHACEICDEGQTS